MGEKETMKEQCKYGAELKAEAVKMVVEKGLTHVKEIPRRTAPAAFKASNCWSRFWSAGNDPVSG